MPKINSYTIKASSGLRHKFKGTARACLEDCANYAQLTPALIAVKSAELEVSNSIWVNNGVTAFEITINQE